MSSLQFNIQRQNKGYMKKRVECASKYGVSYTRHNPYYVNCQIEKIKLHQSINDNINAIVIVANEERCQNKKEIDNDNNVNEQMCLENDVDKYYSLCAITWYDRLYASPFKTPLLYKRSNVYIIGDTHTSCKQLNCFQKRKNTTYLQNNSAGNFTLNVQNRISGNEKSNALVEHQNRAENYKHFYYTSFNNCGFIKIDKESKRRQVCKVYECREICVEGSPITVRAIISKRYAPRASLVFKETSECTPPEEHSVDVETHIENNVNNAIVSDCVMNSNKHKTHKYVADNINASGALIKKNVVDVNDDNEKNHSDELLLTNNINHAICCNGVIKKNVIEIETSYAHKELSQYEEEESYRRKKCVNDNQTSFCSSNEQETERRTQGITIDIADGYEYVSRINNNYCDNKYRDNNNKNNNDDHNDDHNICESQWDLYTPRNQRSYSRSFIVHVESCNSISQPEFNCGLSETAPLTINNNNNIIYVSDDDDDDDKEEYERGTLCKHEGALHRKSHYKDNVVINTMNDNNIHFNRFAQVSNHGDNSSCLAKEEMELKESMCYEETSFLRACTPRGASEYDNAHSFYEPVFFCSNVPNDENEKSHHANIDSSFHSIQSEDDALSDDNKNYCYCNYCDYCKQEETMEDTNNNNNNITSLVEELETDVCDEHVFLRNRKNNHTGYIHYEDAIMNAKDEASLRSKSFVESSQRKEILNSYYHSSKQFEDRYDTYEDALVEEKDDANLFSLYAKSDTHRNTGCPSNTKAHRENRLHGEDNATSETADECNDDWEYLQMMLLHRNRENAELMQEIMNQFLDAPNDDGDDSNGISNNDDDDDCLKHIRTRCNCNFCSSNVTVNNNSYSDRVCLHNMQCQERIMESEYSEKHSKALEELMSKICESSQSLHRAYSAKRTTEIAKTRKNRRKIWQKSQVHPLINRR